MNLYLAGPMSGIPEFNFPLFNRTAKRLRQEGHSVFNPAERDIERHGGTDISKGNKDGCQTKAHTEHGFSLGEALADDTHWICMNADAIVLLPGWEQSAGANAEWALCKALQKDPNRKRRMLFFYLNEGDLPL